MINKEKNKMENLNRKTIEKKFNNGIEQLIAFFQILDARKFMGSIRIETNLGSILSWYCYRGKILDTKNNSKSISEDEFKSYISNYTKGPEHKPITLFYTQENINHLPKLEDKLSIQELIKDLESPYKVGVI